MKLLSGVAETVTDGDFEVKVSPVTRAKQIEGRILIDKRGEEGGLEACNQFFLRECIDAIKIKGESFDPIVVADFADVSDYEVAAEIEAIVAIAASAIYPSLETKKK